MNLREIDTAIAQLLEEGLIEATGRTRANRLGVQEPVFVATEKGRQEAARLEREELARMLGEDSNPSF